MSEHLLKYYRSPKLLGLSYSGFQSLSSCPTRWMLRKLNAAPKEDTIHTIYGKTFGEGVQAILAGEGMARAIWKMFMEWKLDLDEVGKANKGFYYALHGLEIFNNIWQAAFADRYELAIFEGKPAVELGVKINLPGGYYYVIYIDAVLVDKTTGELVVLELKTTGAKSVEEVTYKNSNQALGYGVVLDKIARTMGAESSSYTVLYLVFQTESQQLTPMPFPKSYKQRARFLKDLILRTQVVEFYKQNSFFPTDGGGCKSYGQTCEFYGICELDVDKLVQEHTLEQESPLAKPIQYEYSFEELVGAQQEML